MKKIYIAGPDVFFADIAERAQQQKQLCSRLGMQALHPVDQPELKAEVIYRNNLALLAQADAVVANLDPFRGAEVDTGTAFEVGYAVAKGLPVVGYVTAAETMRDRVARYWGPLTQDAERATWHDREGQLVENFALRVNLMIGVSCPVIVGDFERALRHLQTLL